MAPKEWYGSVIYTREQLIHELMKIIARHDSNKPNYTYDTAKDIADLIGELNTESYCEGFQDS